MDCGDFKDLPRRAIADKILSEKAFDIAKKQKVDLKKQQALIHRNWLNKMI